MDKINLIANEKKKDNRHVLINKIHYKDWKIKNISYLMIIVIILNKLTMI